MTQHIICKYKTRHPGAHSYTMVSECLRVSVSGPAQLQWSNNTNLFYSELRNIANVRYNTSMCIFPATCAGGVNRTSRKGHTAYRTSTVRDKRDDHFYYCNTKLLAPQLHAPLFDCNRRRNTPYRHTIIYGLTERIIANLIRWDYNTLFERITLDDIRCIGALWWQLFNFFKCWIPDFFATRSWKLCSITW